MSNPPNLRRELIDLLLPALAELLRSPQAIAAGAPANSGPLAELLSRGLADRLESGGFRPTVGPIGRAAQSDPELRVRQLFESDPTRSFTLDELASLAGLSRDTAAACVSSLVQAGSIVRDGYFLRLPGPDDELPPHGGDGGWDGGPDRRTGTTDRRGSDDRRYFDRRRR